MLVNETKVTFFVYLSGLAEHFLYFLSLLYHIIWLNLFLYGFHLISAVCFAFQHGIQFSFNHLLA